MVARRPMVDNPEGHSVEDSELGGDTRLRRGWTTGACATAAARAAYTALVSGFFPDPVTVALPGGQHPAFVLASREMSGGGASAAVEKDAGDDPDVTHGALVRAWVRPGAPGAGVTFAAGPGVGRVTKPGLPLAVGEPAINPAPRKMIADNLEIVAAEAGVQADVEVTVGIDGGAALAEKTWNPRLGIVDGLSVLGTTGVVIPYSCSAWIASIHQGVDVARAAGVAHIAGATGKTSEAAVAREFGLTDEQLIDMGDFVGGLLKYLRGHPVARLTIAGGFGKISKLALGAMDLHSKRSQVDPAFLGRLADEAGLDPDAAGRIAAAGSAGEILELAGAGAGPLADAVALRARDAAAEVLRGAVAVDVVIYGRDGARLGGTA